MKKKVLAKKKVVCGLDSSGSREGPVVGSCERGNEHSFSAFDGKFLVRKRQPQGYAVQS